jgi:hypothetical protein
VRATALVLLLGIIGCVDGARRDAVSAHVPSDSSCAFVRVATHPDPAALLREFVARDARGEFMEASSWFNGAITCPGHEPGPDAATMARNPRTRIFGRVSDSLTATVTWERIGYFGNGGDTMDPGVEIDTLVLLRTPFGWRIASPALNPHAPVPPIPRP